MAYFETTGLLEIDRNYRHDRRYSARIGKMDVLERFIGRIAKSFASRRATTGENAPLARMSDRMLEDIGLTRAEALELDRRAGNVR